MQTCNKRKPKRKYKVGSFIDYYGIVQSIEWDSETKEWIYHTQKAFWDGKYMMQLEFRERFEKDRDNS